MAKTVTIPIADHATDGICTNYYVVRYKPTSSPTWIVVSPNPVLSPITLTGLAPSTTYDLEVTRYCCDGIASTPLTSTFTTPA
jgi:hypothetical protein